ncbi:hypothetical protein [Pontibacter amylolyticus]|uniref:hypothetical protein n=1 Tax=Pontibacter amylolyticus TaxID=1424080 RepID=UPI00166F03AC|nr:hypothetical protein [Pontibacter amylolyticus]
MALPALIGIAYHFFPPIAIPGNGRSRKALFVVGIGGGMAGEAWVNFLHGIANQVVRRRWPQRLEIGMGQRGGWQGIRILAQLHMVVAISARNQLL